MPPTTDHQQRVTGWDEEGNTELGTCPRILLDSNVIILSVIGEHCRVGSWCAEDG